MCPCMTLYPAYKNLSLIATGTYGAVYHAIGENGSNWALKQLEYLN